MRDNQDRAYMCGRPLKGRAKLERRFDVRRGSRSSYLSHVARTAIQQSFRAAVFHDVGAWWGNAVPSSSVQ